MSEAERFRITLKKKKNKKSKKKYQPNDGKFMCTRTHYTFRSGPNKYYINMVYMFNFIQNIYL